MCRPKMPKVVSQFIHTQKRAKERMGFSFTREMYNEIIHTVENKPSEYKADFIFKQSNRVSIYRITIDHITPFMICFDNKRHAIATIFTEDKDITYVSQLIDVYGNPSNISEQFNVKSLWLNSDGDVQNLPDAFIRDGNMYHHPEQDRNFYYDGIRLNEVMA